MKRWAVVGLLCGAVVCGAGPAWAQSWRTMDDQIRRMEQIEQQDRLRELEDRQQRIEYQQRQQMEEMIRRQDRIDYDQDRRRQEEWRRSLDKLGR